MKRLLALTLVLTMGIALAQGETLRVLLSSQLTTLEPQETTDTDSAAVRYQIYNGLLRMTEDGNAVADLAESWEINEDGTVYTFTLKDGVTFHDGTALDADAVVASFERLVADERDTSASAYFKPILASVEATGDLEVTFTLNEPFAPFLNTLAHAAGHIMSPAAIEAYGEDVGENPVGTGPYRFVEWVRGERLVLERFDDYFGGTPPLAGIEYRVVPEAATRVALLETGEADVILRVSPDEAERLRGTEGIELKTTPTARAMFVAINTDPRARSMTPRPPGDQLRRRHPRVDRRAVRRGRPAARLAARAQRVRLRPHDDATTTIPTGPASCSPTPATSPATFRSTSGRPTAATSRTPPSRRRSRRISRRSASTSTCASSATSPSTSRPPSSKTAAT